MTEEQFQSSDIQEINGTEDDNIHEQNNETTSNTSSSAPPPRRSRFFRSKRKQRLNEEQSHQVDSNSEVSNEPENSSESPGKNIKLNTEQKNHFCLYVEEPVEETPVKEISTTDTNTPVKPTVTKRSLSPPPPPPSSDDTDEPDASSISEQTQFHVSSEYIDAEHQIYLSSRSKPHEKTTFAQPRPSLPTIHSGYQRKKSQSVKLTSIHPIDAYPKKNVRFADDFGLDLSQIKVIKSDELPHVPSAAFKDLHISNDENSTSFYQERMRTISYLEQQFENPIHAHGFEDRVLRHKVVLEQASKSLEQYNLIYCFQYISKFII
jgi:hypothetical protein